MSKTHGAPGWALQGAFVYCPFLNLFHHCRGVLYSRNVSAAVSVSGGRFALELWLVYKYSALFGIFSRTFPVDMVT